MRLQLNIINNEKTFQKHIAYDGMYIFCTYLQLISFFLLLLLLQLPMEGSWLILNALKYSNSNFSTIAKVNFNVGSRQITFGYCTITFGYFSNCSTCEFLILILVQ